MNKIGETLSYLKGQADANKTPQENYMDYLKKHNENVSKAYEFLVNNKIIERNETLDNQIKEHDKSKYDSEEFEPYAQKFYGTPNEQEFKMASERHNKLNPHHWKYWVDYNGNPKDMPDNYIVEMICDWLSFSIMKNDFNEIQEWYFGQRDRFNMTDKTRNRVEEIIEKVLILFAQMI